MPIGMLFDGPGITREQYEEMNDQMFGTQQPDNLPEGLIIHTAGPTADGWRIFDVWESREAFARFMEEQVMPVAEAMGLPQGPEPQIYELHNIMQAQKAGV